jgi:hypothetical protein
MSQSGHCAYRCRECVLATRSCGVPLRGLGSGFTAHGRRFARVGLTRARQAGGIRRSGPPSPALPLELLTRGAVVPTGPQLAHPGQSRGLTCAANLPSPSDKRRKSTPKWTQIGPKRYQLATLEEFFEDWRTHSALVSVLLRFRSQNTKNPALESDWIRSFSAGNFVSVS